MEKGIFVKPADKPKRFTARITTGGYNRKKKGPYWCSEQIKFINEWRYYVVNGKIIFFSWYQGYNEDMTPPEFFPELPSNWCGCIDMGITIDNKFVLVEAGEPYSIDWYGKLEEGEIYSNFLIEGWRYLKNDRNKLF